MSESFSTTSPPPLRLTCSPVWELFWLAAIFGVSFFWLSGYLVGLCRSLCLSVFVSVSVCANVLQLFMYVFLGLIAPGPCKPSGLPNKVCLDFYLCLIPSFQFCLRVFFFHSLCFLLIFWLVRNVSLCDSG